MTWTSVAELVFLAEIWKMIKILRLNRVKVGRSKDSYTRQQKHMQRFCE